ncbi:SAM-dependent methyltransferase [Actinoplanes aureus]|uniref:SAM-dependent methyltransferase n=1 Tax=Actinoplanes aureus TaxID=2792083 RepID=UPI0028162500|nr:SAM-dependent methyltransferase [Actinoplanes aureus]
MSTTPDAPATIDPNRPSAARIYDAFLGGTHNFAADRAVAARAVELLPEIPLIVRANRAFLRRAVRYATDHGICQFLDLGSGIPAEGNVHEVARSTTPDARVVYVDIDPTAVLYGRHVLGDDPHAAVVHGDLQQPGVLLDEPEVRDLLDLSRPIAVLMIAVLHFVPDSPALDSAMVAYREAVVPGSHLAISHVTAEARPELVDSVTDLYNRTGTPLVPRAHRQVTRFFDGWRLAAPGLVPVPEWRPAAGDLRLPEAIASVSLAGVGVK